MRDIFNFTQFFSAHNLVPLWRWWRKESIAFCVISQYFSFFLELFDFFFEVIWWKFHCFFLWIWSAIRVPFYRLNRFILKNRQIKIDIDLMFVLRFCIRFEVILFFSFKRQNNVLISKCNDFRCCLYWNWKLISMLNEHLLRFLLISIHFSSCIKH